MIFRPNARVISFHKTGSVGIQVAGGNSLGIFVAAIRDDSAAAKEGLKPGDQILMVCFITYINYQLTKCRNVASVDYSRLTFTTSKVQRIRSPYVVADSLLTYVFMFIFQCNEIDFEDITREEAVLILLALPDDVSLVVESKKDSQFVFTLVCSTLFDRGVVDIPEPLP